MEKWQELNRARDLQTERREWEEKQTGLALRNAYKQQLERQIALKEQNKQQERDQKSRYNQAFRSRFQAAEKMVEYRSARYGEEAHQRLAEISQENMIRVIKKKQQEQSERLREKRLYRNSWEVKEDLLKEAQVLQEEQREQLRRQLKESIELKELNRQRSRLGEMTYQRKLMDMWFEASDRTEAERNAFLGMLKSRGQNEQVYEKYKALVQSQNQARQQFESSLVEGAAADHERRLQMIEVAQESRRMQLKQDYYEGLTAQLNRESQAEEERRAKAYQREQFEQKNRALMSMMAQEQEVKKAQNREYLQFLKAQEQLKKKKERLEKEMLPHEQEYNRGVLEKSQLAIPGFNFHDSQRSRQLQILQRAFGGEQPGSRGEFGSRGGSKQLTRSGMNVLS